MAEDNTKNDDKDSTASAVVEKKRRGIISRIWNGLFRLKGDDFEKRLQYISKEEAAVLARMKRRSQSWRRTTRHLIILTIIFEVIAVGYAIMMTRSMELNWKMRALRVLPMFLLPALSSLAYSAFVYFTRMYDRKDQKTLERLRAERQAKIDELKERTNYYTTQQLIQRYDPDPAAKAAAATVLASKLGADSGLKVFVGDESKINVPREKSNDVEVAPCSSLRNRKQLQTRSSSAGSTPLHYSDDEISRSVMSEGPQPFGNNQLVVNHHYPDGSTMHDGGWIARIAALLVGEDPTQSYALICGNCHMHNGLARKEDFPFITYYCPHCHALNKPKQSEEHVSGSISTSPNTSSLATDLMKNDSTSLSDSGHPSNSPVIEESGIEESEKVAQVDVDGGHPSNSHTLNKPKQSEEHVSGSISTSPNTSSLATDLMKNDSTSLSDSGHPSNSPVIEGSGIEESEKVAQVDVDGGHPSNSPIREGSGIEDSEKVAQVDEDS